MDPYPAAQDLTKCHSANLIRMPGARGAENLRMPFHMAQSSLGLVFSNYEHIIMFENWIINYDLQQAIGSIGGAMARDPSFQNRPVSEMRQWTHPEQEIALYIEPKFPNMTYGKLFAVLHMLRKWAQEYESEACSFEIWAFPGTARSQFLGMGHFLTDPDPP
ncbi:MAG: hypothetical protein Q9169_004963 [Polycauliona sp. 2 TL-2023]